MSRGIEIWSGGQTGVDRAALDLAIELGLRWGGWMPLGRLAEDGTIPDRYDRLRESDSRDHRVRTRLNVRDTDATLVLRWGPAVGGTAHTLEVVVELGRPCCDIDLASMSRQQAAAKLLEWLKQQPPRLRLNVAGPRASEAPEGYRAALEVLRQAFTAALSNSVLSTEY